MASNFSTANVSARLERALCSDSLPLQAQQIGQRLLARLKSPVRVALLGLPGSGKSVLLNALVGQHIIPEGVKLPSLEIGYGDKATTAVVSADKVIDRFDGVRLDQPVPAGADLVQIEIPNKALINLRFLEVSLEGSPQHQQKIIDWAQQRADIAMWCTQDFSPLENALWTTVRDALKDNSFLVLTKADLLAVKQNLAVRISELDDVVAEEFYCLFAIASAQALSAIQPDGTKNEDLWLTSGARSLLSTIMQRVKSGRSADRDSALLFLKKNNVPFSSERPDTAESNAPVTIQDTAKRNEIMTNALGILQTRAADLETSVNYLGTDTSAEILDHCLAITNETADLFFNETDDQPAAPDLHEDFMEVSDMLVLMQLEKDSGAAADAVTLLLQLKKEMSIKLAA